MLLKKNSADTIIMNSPIFIICDYKQLYNILMMSNYDNTISRYKYYKKSEYKNILRNTYHKELSPIDLSLFEFDSDYNPEYRMTKKITGSVFEMYGNNTTSNSVEIYDKDIEATFTNEEKEYKKLLKTPKHLNASNDLYDSLWKRAHLFKKHITSLSLKNSNIKQECILLFNFYDVKKKKYQFVIIVKVNDD